MSRSFPPPPVRSRPIWNTANTVPVRRVLAAPTPAKAVTPPDTNRSDRFVTAPDEVRIETSQPRERRPLKPLPVAPQEGPTSAPEAAPASTLATQAPEGATDEPAKAPASPPADTQAPVAPEATQAPAKAAPEVVTVKHRHKPGPAERRRLKAAREAAKSAGKPFDNDALFLAVAGKHATPAAPKAPEAATAPPVVTSAPSKPVSGSAITQAAESRITLLRGQIVNDCEGLANTARSIARRIKAGETPRQDGEFGIICRAMDARCTALYELLLLTRTR